MTAPDGRPLLDAASPTESMLGSSLARLRAVAANVRLPLPQRLDAFEDAMESEVGDTMLVRARNLERETGLRQVYLKFEGDNPTGTQKDRIAFAQAMDALRRGFDTITLATCGNYGAAMAFAAGLAGLRCVVFVPERYHTRRIQEMSVAGVEIRRVPGDYEDAVVLSRQWADDNEHYDANPGGANERIQIDAYKEIAGEIYDVLRDAPAVVAVPVSNGTTLAGVYRGFQSLLRRGKTSRLPRMIAGSAYRKNPIVAAFRKGLDTCEDLRPEAIHQTVVNEPLINWHAIDGDPALAAIRATDGWVGDATDKRMQALARTLREQQGLHVLPASTAGLLALLDRHAADPLPPDRYVAVLTGRFA